MTARPHRPTMLAPLCILAGLALIVLGSAAIFAPANRSAEEQRLREKLAEANKERDVYARAAELNEEAFRAMARAYQTSLETLEIYRKATR